MLLNAVRNNLLEMTELLLEKGADYEVLDNNDMNALMHAVRQKNSAMVNMLIKAGASVDGSLEVCCGSCKID